jgi:hypothetical protein
MVQFDSFTLTITAAAAAVAAATRLAPTSATLDQRFHQRPTLAAATARFPTSVLTAAVLGPLGKRPMKQETQSQLRTSSSQHTLIHTADASLIKTVHRVLQHTLTLQNIFQAFAAEIRECREEKAVVLSLPKGFDLWASSRCPLNGSAAHMTERLVHPRVVSLLPTCHKSNDVWVIYFPVYLAECKKKIARQSN